MSLLRANRLVFSGLALLIAACGSRTGLLASSSAVVSDDDDAAAPADASAACNGGTLSQIVYVFDGNGLLYTFDPKTSIYTAIATPNCGNDNVPWTMTASRENVYILYTDWTLYAVDLTTFACTQTPFQNGQLGLSDEYGIAIAESADGVGTETLFVYGIPDGKKKPILATSDLDSFVLTKVGDVEPLPPGDTFPINLTADQAGNLYAYAPAGELLQIDEATGAVTAAAHTNVVSSSTWANASFGSDVYLFADSDVAGYDLSAHEIVSNVTTAVSPIGAASVLFCHSP